MVHRVSLSVYLLYAVAALLAWSVPSESSAQSRVRRSDGRALTPGLPSSTPEAQGMDSVLLAEGIDFLASNKDDYRVHAAVVIRNGHVVLDARFYPFAREELHDIASVTKSLTATLVGIAIDHGYLSVDDRVVGFFPDLDIANNGGRKRSMTIGHLLGMRAGFECDPSNSEATLTAMTLSPDWVQFAIDLPMDESPGRTWVYCSPNAHLLSAILERATGADTFEFAQQHMFRPLGITDLQWLRDPQGVPRGWGDLHLGTMDMAKLGQLYLDGGSWLGREIVSPDWIDAATSAPPGTDPPAGWPAGEDYGYLWYLGPDLMSAEGRGGQLVFVYPNDHLVIALNAGGGGAGSSAVIRTFFDSYVRGAIQSEGPLSPNPAGAALLNSAVDEAALSDEGPAQPVPALPTMASTVSGVTYDLEPNPSLISTVRVTFTGNDDEALFEAELPELGGGPELEIRVGLDDVSRFSPGRFGLPLAAKGLWVSDDRFMVRLDEVGLITLWRYTLRFVGNRVFIDMDCLAGGEPSWSFEGVAR